ncbi:hypothetical protein [Kitasatospora paracochleata]|uniref:SUKH-4 immunity protein of toxin-antitoxin system n=1 Tax=Kitasatospora paracochleata TaxID=58354 RepID=A0ABT1JAT3_9ACTN|nr:hypothetical protein [Kitasatospora paracochleata]MCP2314550.1 hypothetical protein [Kitasatospora paracochleata]
MVDESVVEAVVARLRAAGGAEGAEPHPRAGALVLPDGRPAPQCIRLWAAFDNFYPLNGGRSSVPVADDEGVLVVEPMDRVLRRVCLESIEDEIDDETAEYLEELVEKFAADLPGYGAVLADEHPDPVLWISASAEVSVLWYRHDAFDRRIPFLDLIADL